MTLIFNGTCTFNTTGWYQIAPQTPFWYNGYSNLLIYWVNEDGTGYQDIQILHIPQLRPIIWHQNIYSDTYSDVFPTSTGSSDLQSPEFKNDV